MPMHVYTFMVVYYIRVFVHVLSMLIGPVCACTVSSAYVCMYTWAARVWMYVWMWVLMCAQMCVICVH